MEEEFDVQSLTEKLAKLNSSQQCIESLSRWCIMHRKKAKQVVETWDKSFKSAKSEQRVSFLYLANDILQNSRRKGSEFVNEFWKYLPAAVKHVYDSGDENGKKASSRLVDIWEERKVFGSRGQNLKDEILGKNPPPIASNGKSSSAIKIIKKDSQSLRIKLAVGGLPEKIVSAFLMVLDENANEEGAFKKCRDVVACFKQMERDIENSSFQGNFQASEWSDKIQEQENIIRQCVSQLEKAETTRVSFISQLLEAIQDQEKNLEETRRELQVARGQLDQVAYMNQRLTSSSVPPQQIAANPLVETTKVAEANVSSTQLTGTAMLPLMHPATFATSKLTDEESKKATAAAVAAKLAASTSSAQMLTSVLSSLVAEEAASLSSSLSSAGFSSSLPYGSADKRPKLEKPASFSDMNHSEGNHSGFFASGQQQPVSNMSLPPSVGMQLMSQGNQMQAPFPQPPPPPPPSVGLSNSPASQIGQSTATMMGGMPYGYGGSSLPPPPLPSHLLMAFSRPAPLQQPPQQQQQQQQQQPQQQQPPSSGSGYYRPPGIGFYGQSHQPTTPPVPRQ